MLRDCRRSSWPRGQRQPNITMHTITKSLSEVKERICKHVLWVETFNNYVLQSPTALYQPCRLSGAAVWTYRRHRCGCEAVPSADWWHPLVLWCRHFPSPEPVHRGRQRLRAGHSRAANTAATTTATKPYSSKYRQIPDLVQKSSIHSASINHSFIQSVNKYIHPSSKESRRRKDRHPLTAKMTIPFRLRPCMWHQYLISY